MPVFEFHCSGCGRDFERLLFSAAKAVCCPGCGSAEVIKKPSLFGTSGLERRTSTSSACAGCSSGACASCGR